MSNALLSLSSLADRSRVVRSALDLSEPEGLEPADQARVVFECLLVHRHSLAVQLHAAGKGWKLCAVPWPRGGRAEVTQAQLEVLSLLLSESQRMERELSAGAGVQVAA